jgi:hypothetical protein
MQLPRETSGPKRLITVNTDLHVDVPALTSTIGASLQAPPL